MKTRGRLMNTRGEAKSATDEDEDEDEHGDEDEDDDGAHSVGTQSGDSRKGSSDDYDDVSSSANGEDSETEDSETETGGKKRKLARGQKGVRAY
jgi:hypothetical protein